MTEDKKPVLATGPKNETKITDQQTARDKYRKLIANDPRFREAPKAGRVL